MTRSELRSLLVATGLSIPELARILEVSPETVRSWRIGRRKPCCRHHETAIRAALLWRIPADPPRD